MSRTGPGAHDGPGTTSAHGNLRFFLALAAVALVVAGGISFYASSHPDGLEHVAETTGFVDTAEDHANADSPLADYTVKGIDDARLSGGLAGVVGVLVTLTVAGGLGLALRRKGRAAHDVGVDPVDSGDSAPRA